MYKNGKERVSWTSARAIGHRPLQIQIKLRQVDEILEIEQPPQDHLQRQQAHDDQVKDHEIESRRAHLLVHVPQHGLFKDHG